MYVPNNTLILIFHHSVPVGDYSFLEETSEDLQKLKMFFKEVENTHQGRAQGLLDKNMPSWDASFPRDKDGGGQGFFIEADVHIPPSRHHYLEGLPPAPAHTKIATEDLPPHMQFLVRERYGENYEGGKTDKLIASLSDKRQIVMHHSTARIYARIGACVTVRRVLSFRQKNIMNQWVQRATEGRRRASLRGDDLLVNLYKLIINAVFGKTIGKQLILFNFFKTEMSLLQNQLRVIWTQ